MVHITDSSHKEIAFRLRMQGMSYREINLKIGVPKGTLSSWFRDDKNSVELKEALTKIARKKASKQLKLMAISNKKRWANINNTYREIAVKEFPQQNSDSTFVTGLTIYWGEGDKTLANSQVRVSNVDFRLLKTFVVFLRKNCKVSNNKIKAVLLLYPDLKDDQSKKYWSRKLGISLKYFGKSQYIKGREKKKRLSYGVCTVYVCNRELKEKIIKWIDLLYNYQVRIVSIV